jgi:hypothetical protein
MNAWDFAMMELVKATRSGWDWSFIDARILWPVAYFVGICILLTVLDHDQWLGNRHDHESHRESITTKGRDQGV